MRRWAWLMPVLVVATLVSADHATKELATRTLRGGDSAPVIEGVFQLTYAENHDVAFSLLSWVPDRTRLKLIITVGVSAVLLLSFIWWRRAPTRRTDRAAYLLMLGGALGNLLDRVFRGYVVDFIHVIGWPVFNAADVFIVVGIILFMLSFRRGSTRLLRPRGLPA